MSALQLDAVSASHGKGARAVLALAPTTLNVEAGESVAVIGRSGAGKSTLAEVVLGLRRPDRGQVVVDGRPWCSPTTLPARAERHLVQGVPQDAGSAFVPRWTLRQSIENALRRLTGDRDVNDRLEHAVQLAHLDPDLLERRPTEVSGGQAQRAAIARAVAVGPAVLVADEPTSALDAATAASVSSALLSIAKETGIALLLVTHDPALAARCTTTHTISAPDTGAAPFPKGHL